MPSTERVRVLVVDDSALMRKLIADLLGTSPDMEVVGLARDAEQALALAIELRPDVVTLDVEMPGRSGLEVLPHLLAACPVPVLMVSALTHTGAEATVAALELGAVDYMPKPTRHQLAEMRACRDLLIAKVKAAARSRVIAPARSVPRARPAEPSRAPAEPRPVATGSKRPAGVVVVGISTGGPQALGQVLPALVPPFPPILIVQHMPASFTAVFARRLSQTCAFPVKEAEAGDRLLPDRILIAPGGRHMGIEQTGARARIALSDEAPVSGHRPSIDVLFQAAARAFGASTIGILMTGMGRDGVEGCKAILAAGGTTYGQDETTSVVYGMNKAAFVESAIVRQFTLDEFPRLIPTADG